MGFSVEYPLQKKKEDNYPTCSSVGALILTFRQRDLMASITFDELLQHNISRQ